MGHPLMTDSIHISDGSRKHQRGTACEMTNKANRFYSTDNNSLLRSSSALPGVGHLLSFAAMPSSVSKSHGKQSKIASFPMRLFMALILDLEL
jgi:hypothetical protein